MTAKPWTPESVETELERHRLPFERRPIQDATQYILPEGTKVNVYQTGKVHAQGKETDEHERVAALFGKTKVPSEIRPASPQPAPAQSPLPKVFVAYGHDTVCRKELELLLRQLKLDPIVLSDRAPDGKTIIEALEKNADVQHAVVLMTPDDEGHPTGQSEIKKPRARQNVVFELGVFVGKLGRPKVAILKKGELEMPSNIDGIVYFGFRNEVSEIKNKLARAMEEAKVAVDWKGLSAE